MEDEVIQLQPYEVAPGSWVLPQLFQVPLAGYINVNSMIIDGEQPVIVDTGPPGRRQQWLEQAWSIVDPARVRWIFLSHDDGDHVGNLGPVLEACPQAQLVTGWFATGRMLVDHDTMLPVPRCVWVNDGDSFDAGDRRLIAVRPPVFDAPTTRGLFDTKTGVYWAADAFGMFVSAPVEDSAEVEEGVRWEQFTRCNTLISPWHRWLDPARYGAHVDTLQQLGIETIACCHGPGFRTGLVDEALRRVRELPSSAPAEEPGQADLESMLAQLAGAVAVGG